jgi:hypothetical protein
VKGVERVALLGLRYTWAEARFSKYRLRKKIGHLVEPILISVMSVISVISIISVISVISAISVISKQFRVSEFRV